MLRIFDPRLMSERKSEFPEFASDAVSSKSKFVERPINAVLLKPEFVKLSTDAVFFKSKFVKLQFDAISVKSELESWAIRVQQRLPWLSRTAPVPVSLARNREPNGVGWIATSKRDFKAIKSNLGG